MGLRDKWKKYKEEVDREYEKQQEKKKQKTKEKIENNPKFLAKQEKENRFREILSNWDADLKKMEMQLHTHRESVFYADEILKEDEKVINFIGADHGKLEDYKFSGVLLLTDARLLYVNKDKKSQFKQGWKFTSLNGIKESGYPMKPHQIQIEIGKSKKLFHKIKKDDHYKQFIQDLQQKIDNPEIEREIKPKSTNKYTQLEKIAELKEKGILNDEEFQTEKEKILNQ